MVKSKVGWNSNKYLIISLDAIKIKNITNSVFHYTILKWNSLWRGKPNKEAAVNQQMRPKHQAIYIELLCSCKVNEWNITTQMKLRSTRKNLDPSHLPRVNEENDSVWIK